MINPCTNAIENLQIYFPDSNWDFCKFECVKKILSHMNSFSWQIQKKNWYVFVDHHICKSGMSHGNEFKKKHIRSGKEFKNKNSFRNSLRAHSSDTHYFTRVISRNMCDAQSVL